MRLGDLDALKKTLEPIAKQMNDSLYGDGIYRALKEIDNAPTVDIWQIRQEATENALKKAEVLYERPQGEWIKITKNGTIPVEYICSVCGRKIFDNYELSVPQSVYYPFCHCGADMRKGGAE